MRRITIRSPYLRRVIGIANLPRNYVIAVESGQRRISFVDADTLAVAYRLGIDGELLDVAVTSDYRKAIASAFEPGRLFEIDLTSDPPSVVNQYASPTPLEDVAITADNRYAISVDGLQQTPQNMVSYRLGAGSAHLAVSDAQSVAASPVSINQILASRVSRGRVRRYSIDADGALTDTGQEVTAGAFPVNLAFTPDGQFAFAADPQLNQIIVLATGQYLGETSRIDSASIPQTIVVSADGSKVYVLSSQEVGIYAFDPIAQRLTPIGSFPHHLVITNYYGVDQMTLSADETILFVAGSNRLAAFDTEGNLLGNVPGVEADGGLASALGSSGGGGLPDNTLIVNTLVTLVFLNQELETVIGDIVTNGSQNVVISGNRERAALPSLDGMSLLEVDLTANPPFLRSVLQSPSPVRGLDYSRDSKFVIGVPPSANGRMLSYPSDSEEQPDIQSIPTDAQAVAVSPDGSGSILAVRTFEGRARRARIDEEGTLSDVGQEVIIGDMPMNVSFTPDGSFAFVPVWGDQEIAVLYTGNTAYLGVTSRISVTGRPQTVLVSDDGRRVRALTTQAVQTFSFDPVAQRLSLIESFPHGLTIEGIQGVRLMETNSLNDRVFVKSRVTPSVDEITSFNLSGERLNQRSGFARGGFAISTRE